MKTLKNTLIQITRNGMGEGNAELGLVLANNYFNLLNEELEVPPVIAFYNEGVKLICAGSPVISALQVLEARGVKLLACKTCLKYFDLMEKMEVGIAGTMIDILELQKVAEKVITL